MDIRLMRTISPRRQTNDQVSWRWCVAAIEQSSGDSDVAGERWRDAIAQLEYAERHGAPADDVEQLAKAVIEARVAMFQAGVRGGWALPAFLQNAVDRDRLLLELNPGMWDEAGWPTRSD
jgi:hypothetical protein